MTKLLAKLSASAALAVLLVLLLLPGCRQAPPVPARHQGELDLREANVTHVAVSSNGTAHDFDVTLYHDDDGEDGYANWWQIESPDGERLGRRVLRHPHGTAPFTRSETVSIPEGMSAVIVRGHDQTHGYGGLVAVVKRTAPDTIRYLQQGAEPKDTAELIEE